MNATELRAVDPSSTDFLLGLLATSHIEFDHERVEARDPTLAEMVEKAVQVWRGISVSYFIWEIEFIYLL